MIYDWYLIFNKAAFEATGLVSKAYTLDLEDIGEKTILVTQGNYISILYEGVLLSLDMIDENPFAFDGHAIYLDANGDVHLGIEVLDED